MFSKEKKLVRWFIFGLVIAVAAGFLIYYFHFQKKGQPSETVYTTPQEVLDAYTIAMDSLRQELVTSTLPYEQTVQKAENIFLAVRVPEGQRDQHLKTFLQLKQVSTTADIVLLIDALLKE